MTLDQILTKVNSDLKYYEVIVIDGEHPVICEDGEYRKRKGYGIINKLTDVVEHTTVLMAGAIFQSQHLDSTLEGLVNPSQSMVALEDMPVEDVTLAN